MHFPVLAARLVLPTQDLVDILTLPLWTHQQRITGSELELLVVESNGFILEFLILEGYHGIEEGVKVGIHLGSQQRFEVIPPDDVEDAVALEFSPDAADTEVGDEAKCIENAPILSECRGTW